MIIIDQFCGAGGSTSAIKSVLDGMDLSAEIFAINHWPVAIETHAKNHPKVHHLCQSIDQIDPHSIIGNQRVKLLWASPECTHFSIARGARPKKEQFRVPAWQIIRWAEALYIENIIIENVKEFLTWGPLGANGQPLKSKKGQTFLAFIQALRSLDYRVEWRILNAANYGDPQLRERFFLIARRPSRKKIVWPEETHSQDVSPSLFQLLQPWRMAHEIVDWDVPMRNFFAKRYADATLRRVNRGLELNQDNTFIVKYRGTSHSTQLVNPLPTVTTVNSFALAAPFVVIQKGQSVMRRIDLPLPTITTTPHLYLCAESSKFKDGCVYPDEELQRYPMLWKLKEEGKGLLYRMLEPKELAAAQSFPEGYKFVGTRNEQFKQIGNAVPGCTAKALVMGVL